MDIKLMNPIAINNAPLEPLNKDAKNDVVLGDDKMPIKDKSIEIDSISFDDIELNFFELKDEEVARMRANSGKKHRRSRSEATITLFRQNNENFSNIQVLSDEVSEKLVDLILQLSQAKD